MGKSTNIKAALFWDEGFFWSLFARDALLRSGIAFDAVNSSDIKTGKLGGYGLLIVPGGWASNKLKALGPEGSEAVRDFVRRGGGYLGICGGAGLGTSEGIGLVDARRKPLSERVPSLSGPVGVIIVKESRIFKGVTPPVFYIWWPSQFIAPEESVIARFGHALDGAYSSDLPVTDVAEDAWPGIEERYGINLDPSKMKADPLVLDGQYGKGRAILSLLHFDMPGHAGSARVLENIRQYFNIRKSPPKNRPRPVRNRGSKLAKEAQGLFGFGRRNFLWQRRGPLVQWQRGIRGFEYFTLCRLLAELSAFADKIPQAELREIESEASDFSAKARRLLMLERLAIQRGDRITFSHAEDPDIKSLRLELFSESKSYGGRFRELIGKIDGLIYSNIS